jgi:lipopolysaccharide/colanic/teichoic acid biosynthesis glycosyltransferase
VFRHESKHYSPELDPTEFYRRVLFPAKAAIDLAYFSRRTVVSDLGWIVRTLWAVVAGSKKEAAIDDRPNGT